MAWENDWRRCRAGMASGFVFGLLQIINLIRFGGDEFIWGSVVGIVYLLLLLSLVGLNGFGLYKAK